MSLTIAQRHAWSLARTLMVCVTLFHAGEGYAAVPTSEYDGDADSIVREYDRSIPERAKSRCATWLDAHRVFQPMRISAILSKHIALRWRWRARPLPLVPRRTPC